MSMRKRKVYLLLLIVLVVNLVLLAVLLKSSRPSDHHGESSANDIIIHQQTVMVVEDIGRRKQYVVDAKTEADERGWIVIKPNERKKQSYLQKSSVKRPVLDEAFENPYVLSADINIHTTPIFAPTAAPGATQKPSHRLVVWSQDFRVGPIAALKHVLAPLGVVIIDQSFSPLCNVTRTCARGLDLVSRLRAWHLADVFATDFYNTYANDARFADVDAFICVYPPSQCELFAAFNKTVILVIDDRFEVGRQAPSRWTVWNKHIVRLASIAKNAVIVTNEYDRAYVEYFTLMSPTVIPFHCGYVNVSYNPRWPQFLLMPSARSFFDEILLRDVVSMATSLKLDVLLERVTVRYGRRPRLLDLARHRALVYVPHQPSYLAFTEHYRAGIPMFVPNVHLLTNWHQSHIVVAGKTRPASQRANHDGSVIKGVMPLPDPNDDTRHESVAYWLHQSDFYRWPHVIQFTSIEDLVHRLSNITVSELQTVSRRMLEHSAKEQRSITKKWTDTLNRIMRYR